MSPAASQDSEVHVPRHLSAKDRSRLAAEAAEEEARARANAGNDMAARALKQMMNGSPAGLPGGASQAAIARPPWMEGDPTQFSPEQQQEVRPFIFYLSHASCKIWCLRQCRINEPQLRAASFIADAYRCTHGVCTKLDPVAAARSCLSHIASQIRHLTRRRRAPFSTSKERPL